MSRSHRPSTTPMDFEWTNQTGPVDSRSPFLTASARQQQAMQAGVKRPHSVLDSPSKASAYHGGFATPNRSGYFTGGSKPLPSTPASSLPAHIQQSQAWEPRTPASNYDFSSGGETPNTPQIDSDTGTPDTQLAGKMGRLGEVSVKKPTRRDSWMAFKGFFGGSPSPSKSERDRDRDRERRDADREREVRRPTSSRKEKEGRIVKRRSERPERSRSKKRYALQRSSDDSDTEPPSSHTALLNDQNASQPKVVQVVQETFVKRLGNLFHWVEAHPALPSVLSVYAQFFVNSLLGLAFLYIIYCAWAGIMSDVDIESSKHTAEVMVEISACATDYQRNHCGTANMAPALESVCGVWETCMGRDPRKVARASVTAKTFAMIFNSFVEEFSYKSMIFTAIIVFGGFNLSNWAFGWMRSHPSQPPPQNQEYNNNNPPQTPHRIPSNPYQQNLLHSDARFHREIGNNEGWDDNWANLPRYGGLGFAQGMMQNQSQTPGRVGGEYTREGMRFIEQAPAPQLVHAQSMPVVPTSSSTAGLGGLGGDEGAGGARSTRKRGLFR
ncbi:hypothetical protein T440DRAFT_419625 [Plenodomus tracheiphilus IPT5]|uniref:Brl1/Brr6 domain-containing protein n=1 Tax=Plenodomus tracheiphilus IPT5 TaxID=1408161 RepID=A0A6A7BDE9_9PLEO|nr:hypothetical protein T440DRAFT_419625 [Plenodomus tracheiphilus IPT5]